MGERISVTRVGRSFDAALRHNVYPVGCNENEIRLDYGRGRENQVGGSDKDFAETVRDHMIVKNSMEAIRNALMVYPWGRCHRKFSVKYFVTVAVVGQLAVVVICQNDFALGNALR
jgi:hypothetical protein